MGRLLRKKEVLIMTGISGSTLWRLIKAGKFPAPVRVSESIPAWPEDQVIAWRNGLETVTAATSKPVCPGSRRGRKPSGKEVSSNA